MARGKNRFGRGDILAGLRSCLKVQEKCGIGNKACPFSEEMFESTQKVQNLRQGVSLFQSRNPEKSVRKYPKSAESETRSVLF